ncbi:MAG: hypothetical protein RDV48_12380, partial [Candidatus Eremiobacteraeota bacterium]|nr:hypothetical protein [Candidatus Eremiobacteraeota bacterium]
MKGEERGIESTGEISASLRRADKAYNRGAGESRISSLSESIRPETDFSALPSGGPREVYLSGIRDSLDLSLEAYISFTTREKMGSLLENLGALRSVEESPDEAQNREVLPGRQEPPGEEQARESSARSWDIRKESDFSASASKSTAAMSFPPSMEPYGTDGLSDDARTELIRKAKEDIKSLQAQGKTEKLPGEEAPASHQAAGGKAAGEESGINRLLPLLHQIIYQGQKSNEEPMPSEKALGADSASLQPSGENETKPEKEGIQEKKLTAPAEARRASQSDDGHVLQKASEEPARRSCEEEKPKAPLKLSLGSKEQGSGKPGESLEQHEASQVSPASDDSHGHGRHGKAHGKGHGHHEGPGEAVSHDRKGGREAVHEGAYMGTTEGTGQKKSDIEKPGDRIDSGTERTCDKAESGVEGLGLWTERDIGKLGDKVDRDIESIGARTERDIEKLGDKIDRDIENIGARTERDIGKLGDKVDRDIESIGARTERDIEKLGDKIDRDIENIGARTE